MCRINSKLAMCRITKRLVDTVTITTPDQYTTGLWPILTRLIKIVGIKPSFMLYAYSTWCFFQGVCFTENYMTCYTCCFSSPYNFYHSLFIFNHLCSANFKFGQSYTIKITPHLCDHVLDVSGIIMTLSHVLVMVNVCLFAF